MKSTEAEVLSSPATTISIFLMVYCALVTAIVGFLYSYSFLTSVETILGVLLLASSIVFLSVKRDWRILVHRSRHQSGGISFGLIIGLLWLLEICLNNIVQIPLPLRDSIDDVLWLVVSILTLAFATMKSVPNGKITDGISAGFLVGSASGLVACSVALSFVIFGMNFLVSDPVNILEWKSRNTKEVFGTIQRYFAFETLTGAYLHFIGLGSIGGLLIGSIGGALGILWKKFAKRRPR